MEQRLESSLIWEHLCVMQFRGRFECEAICMLRKSRSAQDYIQRHNNNVYWGEFLSKVDEQEVESG